MSKLLGSCSTFVLRVAIVFMALLSQPLSPQVAAAPSADFDENGVVDFTDFLLFVSAFGTREGQEKYDAKYDLNGDGEIGFADFLIFTSSFSKKVDYALDKGPIIIRSVAENTSDSQNMNIGDPVSVTDLDGDSLTYRLSGPDANSFTIVSSSGQIQTKAGVTYSYEKKRVYSVIVEVEDGSGGAVPVRIAVLPSDISPTYQKFVRAKEKGTEPIVPDFSYSGYHYFSKPVPDVTHPIFDVTTYGAIPNDALSDQSAIERAIAAAEANGRGIVFFPPGEFLVNTDADNDEPIRISSSNIVLKGSGSRKGGTVIRQINPRLPRTGAIYSTPRMFIFSPRDDDAYHRTETRITESSDRESFWITVADASRFKVDQWIKISMNNNTLEAVNEFLAPRLPDRLWRQILNSGITIDEEHSIAEIQGNRIRLNEPLHTRVNHAYNWKVRSYRYLEEVGVEDISFHGSFIEKFVHHKNFIHDGGYGFLSLNTCVNSWVRRTSLFSVTKGIAVSNSAAVSIYQVTVAGKKGHYGITNSRGYGVWVGLSEDPAGAHHGVGMSGNMIGNVVYRFDMAPGQALDIHKTRPSYASLYDCVNNGRPNGSSGTGVPPHHLGHLVFWNFNHGGEDNKHYSLWGGYLNFLYPIIVGFHGNPATFDEEDLGVLESNGMAVEPESLFEAQLELRLGTLPTWLNNLITEWETLRNIPLPNASPVAKGKIAAQSLTVGADETIDVADYFVDPNNDVLTCSASSSDEGIARVDVVGSVVTITPVASGMVTITVTANDGRLSTQQTFRVRVTDMTIEGEGSIYWVEFGSERVARYPENCRIQRSDLFGSNIEDLITTGLTEIGGLVIAEGKMYWVDSQESKIQRSDLDGSNIEDLITKGLNQPGGLAIAEGKMYWVDRGTGKIQRSDLDGSNIEDLITKGLKQPWAIALDIAGGKMYWVDRGTDKIQRSDLDGSNIEDLITKGLKQPWAIALDIAGGKMYWTDRLKGIWRSDLNGSNIEDLVIRPQVNRPRAIALDISGGKMYWVDESKNKIQRSELDGSNIEDLVGGLNTPASIALDMGAILSR